MFKSSSILLHRKKTKIENKNNELQIQTCIDDTELLTFKIPIE